MDVDTLQPGVDYVTRIPAAIAGCSALIALIGTKWPTVVDDEGRRRLDNPKDFVRLEILAALNRKIRVIPVLVANADLPSPNDLPRSMAKMLRYNAVSLRDDSWRHDVQRLVTSLEEVVPERTASETQSTEARPGGQLQTPPVGQVQVAPHGRRWVGQPPVVWAGAAIVVAAIAVAAVLLSRGRTPGGITHLAGMAMITASSTAPPSVDNEGNKVTYDAANSIDGDPTTAWRTPGDGRGETLTLVFPHSVHIQRIGLVPGYAKIDPKGNTDRFHQNRIVQSVVYRFGNGTSVEKTFVPQPIMQYVDVDVITDRVVVEIQGTSSPPPPPLGRNDTPISEIDIVGTTT